ncbi:MAG: hypothetical protein ACYDAR_13840 [Thermomicrobiales bacterium]
MRRLPFALVVLTLVGCGGTTQVVAPTVAASPVINVAATSTRSAEMAQIATLTAPTVPPQATPTPAPRTAQAVLAANTTATVGGVLSVTITQLGANSAGFAVQFQLRVTNLGTTDVRFTACAFTLRNGKGEDGTPIACTNPSTSEEVGIAPGGFTDVTLIFPYNATAGVSRLRFAPTTPADVQVFFNSP